MSGGAAKSLRSTNDRLRVASDSASNLQSLVNNADREVVVPRHHALRKSGDFALDLHGLGLVGKNEVDRFDPADDKRAHRIGVGINQAFLEELTMAGQDPADAGGGNPAGGPVGSRHRQQLNGELKVDAA